MAHTDIRTAEHTVPALSNPTDCLVYAASNAAYTRLHRSRQEMTSSPLAAAIISQTFSHQWIESSRPAVNTFFYTTAVPHATTLERFDKFATIYSRFRWIAKEVSNAARGPLSLPSPGIISIPDSIFIAELCRCGALLTFDNGPHTIEQPQQNSPDSPPEEIISRAHLSLRNNDPWATINLLDRAPQSIARSFDGTLLYAQANVALNSSFTALGVLNQIIPTTADERAILAYEKGIILLRHLPAHWQSREQGIILLKQAATQARSSEVSPSVRATALNGYALAVAAQDTALAVALEVEAIETQKELLNIDRHEEDVSLSIFRGNLARLLHSSGATDEAKRAILEALRYQPPDTGQLELALRIAEDQGDESLVDRTVHQLSQRSNWDYNAAIALGNYYSKNEINSLALSHYEQALSLDPELVDVRLSCAELYLKNDAIQDSEKHLSKELFTFAERSDLARRDLLLLEIEIRRVPDRERLDFLLVALERLAANYPEDPEVSSNLAMIEKKTGEGRTS